DEHLLLRRRRREGLAVHLLLRQLEAAAHALRDRMAGIADPESLALGRLAPAQRASRAHESLEELREMPRVQDDQTHPLEDARLRPLDHPVVHLAVRLVSPPDQYVRRL